MENASRALLMAGGVLIAIIIITLLVRTYGNIGNFQRQQLSAEETEKLEAYNKEYTKYLNQYVYGTEVISVINKVANYQENNPGQAFEIDITFMNPYSYTLKNGKKHTTKGTLKIKGDEDNKYYFIDALTGDENNQNTNKENINDLKNRAFLCDRINYDNTTGRVNYIHFTEKQIGNE